MSLTLREIIKYSKIQKETAKWVAERFVYMCKVYSKEVEELSKVVQNQAEVFEKEHSEEVFDKLYYYRVNDDYILTMKKLAERLKKVNIKDFEIVSNNSRNEGQIRTYHLSLYHGHVLSHLGMALNKGWNNRKLEDAFCSKIAQGMIDYFEQYELTLLFQFSMVGCDIDIRTNGIRPIGSFEL